MWQTWTGGPAMAPVQSPQSQGTAGTGAGPGGWHPTIIYLIVLLFAETVVVGFLSRTVLR